MFPVSEIPQIESAPEDYKLIRRIPWTKSGVELPIHVGVPVGDEVSVAVLDVETTGFEAGRDKIIELGLVKIKLSPSTGQVTTIVAATSMYEDPGFEIPEIITDITGITNAMVAGKAIDDAEFSRWLEDDPIVLAHNAEFDRGFIQARFPTLDTYRWACSIKDISWRDYGYEGNKLEYLAYKAGAFYEGHRASIDCFAVAWLLHRVPAAAKAVLVAEKKARVKVDAVGSPFDSKDALRQRGYRWNPVKRFWSTEVGEADLPEENAFLAALYPGGDEKAVKTRLTSRDRYKKR